MRGNPRDFKAQPLLWHSSMARPLLHVWHSSMAQPLLWHSAMAQLDSLAKRGNRKQKLHGPPLHGPPHDSEGAKGNRNCMVLLMTARGAGQPAEGILQIQILIYRRSRCRRIILLQGLS